MSAFGTPELTRTSWHARLAIGLVLAFYVVLLAGHYVPAFQGVDQNGYLLLAKRFAATGDAGKHTTDPYEFVSGNSVEARAGVYYGKYPIGYPLLCALAYKLGTPETIFLVNPLLATLAVLGIYCLGRAMFGAWAGVCAAIVLATNPLFNHYALDAGSHAGSICFATWAMYFLWEWSQKGGWMNALLTGALAAYAVSIRYTEGLLALPIAAMVLVRLFSVRGERVPHDPETHPVGAPITAHRHPSERGDSESDSPPTEGLGVGVVRSPRRTVFLEFILMLLAALVAIAPLLTHHWVAFGSPWTSGYALCKEATGFGWKWFQENWWTMLSRMETGGLVLVFPLGLAGLGVLAVRDRSKALLLGCWLLPALLVYTAYYWAPKGEGTGYVRFFLSVFPALILAAWGLWHWAVPGRVAQVAVGGLLALLIGSTGLHYSTAGLAKRIDSYCFSQTTADRVRAVLPRDAAIFANEQVLNFLEFYGDYPLFAQQTFERGAIARHLKVLDTDDPHPFQREKAQRLAKLLGDRNDTQLVEMQRDLIARLAAAHRPVALLVDGNDFRRWRGRIGDEYQLVLRSAWAELRTDNKGEMRTTNWGLYELLPWNGSPDRSAVAALEAKADALQERLPLLRADYDQRFGDAKVEQGKIMALEKDHRDAREELKKLKARTATAANKPPGKPRT